QRPRYCHRLRRRSERGLLLSRALSDRARRDGMGRTGRDRLEPSGAARAVAGTARAPARFPACRNGTAAIGGRVWRRHSGSADRRRDREARSMRILILSCFFPPYNTIGAVRVGKTAKYLVQFGHDVRVIAARDLAFPRSLPLEIAPERVCYTNWL